MGIVDPVWSYWKSGDKDQAITDMKGSKLSKGKYYSESADSFLFILITCPRLSAKDLGSLPFSPLEPSLRDVGVGSGSTTTFL